jgi:hypothetical protein
MSVIAKRFNMDTYKLHAIGHYEECIRLFGTSDGYNTQTVCYSLPIQHVPNKCQGELEHCRVKRFYLHTSKAQFTRGISKQEQRQRILHRVDERVRAAAKNLIDEETREEQSTPRLNASPTVDFSSSEKLPPTDPSSSYHISNETKYKLDLSEWIQQQQNEPSMRVGSNFRDKVVLEC